MFVPSKMPYDVILGKNTLTLTRSGETLDFNGSIMNLNETSVEIKRAYTFNDNNNLINLAYYAEPILAVQRCCCTLILNLDLNLGLNQHLK